MLHFAHTSSASNEHSLSNTLTSNLLLIPCDPGGCCSASSCIFMCVIKSSLRWLHRPLLPSAGRRAICLTRFFIKCWDLPPAWWGRRSCPWTCCVLVPAGSSCPWAGRPPWTRQCRCCRHGCCQLWWPGRRWPRRWSPFSGRRSAASRSDGSPACWWTLRWRRRRLEVQGGVIGRNW